MAGKAFLHFIKVITGLEGSRTQTTKKEREALVSYCDNASLAVEIGVFEGACTALIAKSIPEKAILYGIDPFFKGKLGICYEKLITKRQLAKFRVKRKVRLVEKLSFDAVQDVPENIDFIFIDGDHTWAGIQKDWNDWSKKVKVGGIIALHDTSASEAFPSFENQESIKFFSEVIRKDGSFTLLKTVDSTNILQKAK